MNRVKYAHATKLTLSRIRMRNISPPEVSSYAGSATAIGAAMTLTEIGVLVGIATAVLTFVLNIYFMRRKDQREQRESDVRVAQLMKMKVIENE